MASGDIKEDGAIILEVTAGGAVAVGDLVHIESDGYWDKTADTDTGPFGVALDAASAEGDLIRIVKWGRVEVKASAAVIAKGDYVIADAGVVKAVGTLAETTVYGTIVGIAATAFASGGQGQIYVGMM